MAGWSARQRLWAALGTILVLLGLWYLGALQVLRSAPVRRALQQRAISALAARLPAARLEGEATVDALFRPVLRGLVLPSTEDGQPLLRVDRITVQPRPLRMLQGHLEAGKLILQGVQVLGGKRGERLEQLAQALRPKAPGPGGDDFRPERAESPKVVFSGFELRLEDPRAATQGMVWGPLSGSLQVHRQATLTRVLLATQGPGGAVGVAEATWAGSQGALRVQVRGLGADALPEGLRSKLPFQVQAGTVDFNLEAPHLESRTQGEGMVTLALRQAVLWGRRLHTEPVGPLGMQATGRLRWDAGGRTAELVEGVVALDPTGRAALKVGLSVALRPEPRFELTVRAEALEWAVLTAALPPGFAPPPGAPELMGQLGGRLRVAGPLRRRDEWRLEGEVDARRLLSVGAKGNPELTRPFVYQARLARGGTRPVLLGPDNPAFLPLGELPPLLVRAVLESEDGGFYGHNGFELAELQDALAEGGRLRGASTITQQLAKNLFLSRERTLSRKVREAFATLALEAAVGKRRILELYLNLAEWGDGVNGIGEAARHWFGKDPRQLSPKEAAFLATVIPNPVRYEFYRRRGGLTPAWEARVANLLEKLHTSGVLDEKALRAAMAETLTFTGSPDAQPGPEPEAVEAED